MTNGEAYFEQTKTGESSWWSWLVALWFSIIVWVVLSGFVSSPIVSIVHAINPEAVNTYNQATVEHFANLDVIKIASVSGACLISILFAVVFWLLYRINAGSVRRVFAWISGFFMVVSAICAVILYPFFSNAELNAAFLPLIGESPIAYALMLLTFPAFLVGLYLAQKFVHRRTITSLHTAAKNVNWKRILFAIALTWVVLGSATLLMHVTGVSTVKLIFDPRAFFGFAIATLLFIPLQSGTEEIIFRGYLNQAFGHFIDNKWIVFIITSVMFAAMHLSNPESVAGAEKGGIVHLLVMSQYFLFGFILSVIVYFEGGLEAAIGVHAGNNMFAAMFVNYEGSVLPTPSAFLATPNAGPDSITAIITLAVIAYVLYRTRKKIAISSDASAR